MPPETCRAELKRLINEKVVASCWLFTSLLFYCCYIGLHASYSIPLRYPKHRQNAVDDTMYEHIGLCFFVSRWLRYCGIHISLRTFRSVSCYCFSSVPRGFYAVLANGYKSVVQKNTNRKFFPLTATCHVMYLSLTTANISCPQVILWANTCLRSTVALPGAFVLNCFMKQWTVFLICTPYPILCGW